MANVLKANVKALHNSLYAAICGHYRRAALSYGFSKKWAASICFPFSFRASMRQRNGC
jgi:hypothetical protein